MPEKSRKNRVDLVPINKRGDLTVGEREWRRQMAEQWNKSTAEYRGFTGSSGREHMLPYRYRDLTNRWKYEGVAGSRGYELPGAEVEGVEVSAKRKRVDGYAYGGRVKGKEAKPMKKMAEAKMERSKKDMASDKKMVKGEKGYAMGGFVGRVASNLGGPLGQKLAGMRGGMAGNLMNRMRGRLNQPATAPTPAAPAAPQPAPASVQRAIPQAAQAAAPAPAPAPATTPRPGYAYGGKVSDPKSGVREGEMSSKKQGMDPKSAARLDEMKWVKGVQKKAGYAFGGMVKGGKGKKGC